MPKKVKSEKDNSERWLLTYSDLMNLLLILFILLYTMANVDVKKYQQVANSLNQAFGRYSGGGIIDDAGGSPYIFDLGGTADPDAVVLTDPEEQQMEMDPDAVSTDSEEQQMDAVQKKVQELVDELGLTGDVSVVSQERGIYISIGEHVLFKSGSAELSKEAKERIIKIGKEILTKMPDNQMRVEGHTDDIPINTPRFPDNQELSTARANNVWRVLVKDAGIDPTKISATGYGEFRPIVPNDTEEHRKMNRRVDIVILREIYDVTEPGSENTNKSEETSKTGSGESSAG